MLKKYLIGIFILFTMLLTPILGQAITTFMPYYDPQGNVENIIIELPPSITEDFTKWAGRASSYKSGSENRPNTVEIDAIICELEFSKEDTSNNTIYILYVYCHKPIVLALQEVKKDGNNNYWLYYKGSPFLDTEKAVLEFLASKDFVV